MAPPTMLRAVLAASLALSPSWASAAVDEPLSLQGFSGVLDTPTAFTHTSGSAHLLFTNQLDPRFRSADAMRTYVLSIGLFRYLEVGGRVSETQTSMTPAAGSNTLDFAYMVDCTITGGAGGTVP